MPFKASVPLFPANDALPPSTIDSPAADAAPFPAAAPGDLQDMVDTPCRTLDVEYKSWRDLDNPEDQAELARDIAALANHGGGFVVFGFDEHTLLSEDVDPLPTDRMPETVAAIVQSFLEPTVGVAVSFPVAADQRVHPVIRVESHGAVPVCVCRDGPAVGGEPLVRRGTYYRRKHGAEAAGRPPGVGHGQSVPVEGPQDWAPLIRRCVRRDREVLLGMLEAVIEGRTHAPGIPARLLTWHDAARAAFLGLVPRSPVAEQLGRCHYALSYAFDLVRPELLEHAQLPERLRRTLRDVQTRFRSGWNMFDPPHRHGVQARFMTDPALGENETDFLETAWLRARPPQHAADFWRVSPKGFASIVRGYAEDMPGSGPSDIQPGTCLSPEVLAQDVAEFVCHATTFARMFSGVRRVVFRCEWWGLRGRELYDPDYTWPHRGPALADHCAATAQVPHATLVQAWPDVVAQLMAPVLRVVEPNILLSAEWVRGQAPRWASQPD